MFLSSAVAQDSAASAVPVRDTVTFWIAVLGFALSVYNFVVSIYANHKHISVRVKFTYKVRGYVLLSIQITNKSKLGISLTSGEIDGFIGRKIAFGETSSAVFTYAHPDLSGKSVLRTDIFPIHVEPLHSVRVFMQTETWNPDLPCSCRLRFGSSRGWIQAKVDLPEDFEDFESLLRRLK